MRIRSQKGSGSNYSMLGPRSAHVAWVQPLPRMQTLQLSNTPEQPVKQGKLERVLLAVPLHGVQVVAPLVTAPVPLPTSATEPTGHAEQLVCPLWVWNRSVGQGLHGTEERGENWPAGQAEQLVAAEREATIERCQHCTPARTDHTRYPNG